VQDLTTARVYEHTRSPRNHAFAFRATNRPSPRCRRTHISAGQPVRGPRARRRATARSCVARYYDPASGQFLTRDPIAALTRAAYAYAGNNPTNFTDPTGLIGFPSLGDVVDVVKDVGGRAVDVTVAVVNAPVTATTATINSWTGGDCDWNAHLTVVCYGGAISGASDRTFVTGSTINTTLSKVDFAAANNGRLLAHETVHTRQWALFGGGVGFPLLYGLETLRTGGDECRNVFEIWAGLEDGGYKCGC